MEPILVGGGISLGHLEWRCNSCEELTCDPHIIQLFLRQPHPVSYLSRPTGRQLNICDACFSSEKFLSLDPNEPERED